MARDTVPMFYYIYDDIILGHSQLLLLPTETYFYNSPQLPPLLQMQDGGGVLVCNWPPILPLLRMQDGGGGFSSNHSPTPSLARNTRQRGRFLL